MTVAVSKPAPSTAQGAPLLSARKQLDVITAYREVGTYRGAAEICGVTHKTAKRVVEKNEPAAQRQADVVRGRDVGRHRWDGEDGVGVLPRPIHDRPGRLDARRGDDRESPLLGRDPPGRLWEGDRDRLHERPAHAIGELVPGLLLGAVTGGGSVAASAAREGAERVTTLAATATQKVAERIALMGTDTGAASLDVLTLGIPRAVELLRLSLPKMHASLTDELSRQVRKYGRGGAQALPDGRVRLHSKLSPAEKAGTIVGRRRVREWDPATGRKREWMESIDASGRVRQVRPVTGAAKVHYMFDANGNYIGSW